MSENNRESNLMFLRQLAHIVLLCTLLAVNAKSVTEGPDDEVCLDCHDDQETVFRAGVHQLASLGGDEKINMRCISCHSGAAEHVDDPTIENITNPARLAGNAARDACRACHKPHLNLDNYGFDAHFEQQINCASCHKVHAGEPDLLLSDKAEFCTKCHSNVLADFTKSSQHPLRQQNITCLSCHTFAKRPDSRVRFGQLRVCEDCHPEQAGPFPNEHEATNYLSVEGNGCLECHRPHGSENDHLLRQAGEFLCLNCHVTPTGHLNLPALHGPVRNIKNCVACHSDIHGSFVSSRFLDGMLQSRLGSSQPCADCHELTR